MQTILLIIIAALLASLLVAVIYLCRMCDRTNSEVIRHGWEFTVWKNDLISNKRDNRGDSCDCGENQHC